MNSASSFIVHEPTCVDFGLAPGGVYLAGLVT